MSSSLNTNIRAYEPGEIPARGAMTAQILVSSVPLQGFIDKQYDDSRTMDKRPGMYLKYLPYRYDEVSGKLLTGGSYVFDTYENAKDYARWTDEEFKVGDPKVGFWEQPVFEAAEKQVWKVVGACSFAPVQEHAVGRLQIWQLDGETAEADLQKAYPALRDAAQKEDAAAVWLLYDPVEKRVGIQLAFRKARGTGADSVKRSLDVVASRPSLHHLLPGKRMEDLGTNPLLDRTSLFLTLWLPMSRAAGGAELSIPFYPVVPDITLPHS